MITCPRCPECSYVTVYMHTVQQIWRSFTVLKLFSRFYAKRCFLSLIENLAKHMIVARDSVFQECIQFLEHCEGMHYILPNDSGCSLKHRSQSCMSKYFAVVNVSFYKLVILLQCLGKMWRLLLNSRWKSRISIRARTQSHMKLDFSRHCCYACRCTDGNSCFT